MNEEEQILSPEQPQQKVATQKIILYFLLAIIIVFGIFRFGYISGKSGYTFSLKEFKVVNKSGQSVQVDYSLLWEALDVVGSKYIDKDQIDQQKVLYGAIRGAVMAAGDDYTDFFDPEAYAEFKRDLGGTFTGIGAEIGKKEGNLIIVAPLDDSPAERAGLLPQDIIVKINDESVQEWTSDKAASKIRGEIGTTVKLTIFREGQTETFDVSIVREQIEIKSVKTEYKQVNGKQIAVLTISRFGDDTKRRFDIAVTEILNKRVDGVVLDLRNNPGGYLETSVELASDWLEKDLLVVKEAHSERDVIDYVSTGSNRLGGIKVVTLINEGSASASEILAGALKDHGKTQLIGKKSFGKGSVQELINLSQGSAVKVTVAKWITPGGKNLNSGGLDPDIEVEITEDDVKNKRDPQLNRALQEITK